MFKLVVEREKCISCGICVDLCSELFELDENIISHIIGSERVENNDVLEMNEKQCSVDASESCPAACIHLYDNGVEIVS